jgi:hypothetical protein
MKPETASGRGPLGRVVLLPLTTRVVDGLLGHALHEDGVTPDRSRCILRGIHRTSETSQHVTIIREASADALVSAGYGPAEAEVATGELTHLAYIVEITGYADIGPQAQYRPESDCCFNGQVQRRCGHGYVERVVRGSGVIKYLKSGYDEGELEAADVFQTKAGQRYRVLDEYRFEDAYFGFERGDIEQLCRTLPDGATFEPTHVHPTPNCSVISYDLSGSSKHLSKYLPDLETCRTIGARFCREMPDCVRCLGAYNDSLQVLRFALSIEPSSNVQDAIKTREAPLPPGANETKGDSDREKQLTSEDNPKKNPNANQSQTSGK